MKIIRVSNHDKDDVSDFLVAIQLSEFYAKRIAKLLNEKEPMDGPDYYRAVEDDFKLKVWEP